MEDENYGEPPPRTPEQVARRAIVLSAVSARGFVEGDRANPKEAAELAKKSYHWLIAVGLEDEFTDWEREVLTSPFGTLSDLSRINASWLSEAAVVLAWALGKIDLPGYSEQCDPAKTAKFLGFLQPTDLTALKQPELRAFEELEDYNDFIFKVHWRIRDFSINNNKYDFESFARNAWGEPNKKYGLLISERDLCVNGVPISQSREEDWRTLNSITQERHRASNWMIGYASENFHEVTADT